VQEGKLKEVLFLLLLFQVQNPNPKSPLLNLTLASLSSAQVPPLTLTPACLSPARVLTLAGLRVRVSTRKAKMYVCWTKMLGFLGLGLARMKANGLGLGLAMVKTNGLQLGSALVMVKADDGLGLRLAMVKTNGLGLGLALRVRVRVSNSQW
jgi:hypothetical protein